MKRFLFVGYNLGVERLESRVLVSGEIKNANYLFFALKKRLSKVSVEAVNILVDPVATASGDFNLRKSRAKGAFRWLFESIQLQSIVSTLKENDTLYLTIPSYLPFLRIPSGVKVVVTAHGTYWPELLADLDYEPSRLKKFLHLVNGRLQLLLDKRAFKKADVLHSVSEFQVAEMTSAYGRSAHDIRAVRNGTDFRTSNYAAREGLIWIGRLAKKKNLKMLEMVLRETELRITIVGGSDYFAIDNESVKFLNELKANPRVTVHKELSEYDLEILLNQHKILFVTSTGYESIPTVIFEGLATGCLVVTPDSWGVREVEGSGLEFYEQGNEKSAALAVTRALDSESLGTVTPDVRWSSRAEVFEEQVL